MKVSNKAFMLLIIAVMLIVTAGCGSNGGGSGAAGGQDAAKKGDSGAGSTPAPVTEPVKLKLFFYQPGFSDQDFTEKLQPLLEKKFPNISYELMIPQQGASLEDQVGAGDVPDIIFAGEHEVNKLEALDVPENLDPWIKKYQINMGGYDPTLVSSIKKYSDKGETLALGYAMQYYATFYNKDIFDKFGVSYPKDGLGWNDLLELAKKTTRLEDGTQYYGIIAGGAAAVAQSWALPHVDPKTKKSLYNNDSWKKVFELAHEMYTIPGNMPPKAKMGVAAKDFTQDKNVAIIPWFGDTMINSLEALQKAGSSMNWDMVTYPVSPENPGRSHEISFRSLVLSKVSKNKEAAFQVMKFLSTSDEVQTMLSRVGFGPSLKDAKFQKVFGADREVVKGKNIAAIFKTQPLELRQYTDYDGTATKALNAAFDDYLAGKIDVNTALRQAQENADSAIAGMGM